MGRLVTVFGIRSKKNTGFQGSTLSGPRMTAGFGPFELPTRGLLQKGRDHSPPKVCFEEPSFWLAHSAMGIHSAINIQITKQIGGGAQWVELSLTRDGRDAVTKRSTLPFKARRPSITHKQLIIP